MFIENPEVFKCWLTSILEPLCDADPAALAKYVYALVKKEKPTNDLRYGMLDQLDVFLQGETKPFVDMLFKSLETQEYLRAEIVPKPAYPNNENVENAPADPAEAPAAVEASEPPPLPPDDTDESAPADKYSAPAEMSSEPSTAQPSIAQPPIVQPPNVQSLNVQLPIAQPPSPNETDSDMPAKNRVVVSRNAAKSGVRAPPQEKTLVKVLPLNELLEEPIEPPPKKRDRKNELMRDKDDRRRRRSRSWDWRGKQRRYGSPDRRRPLRTPSPRSRYKNRSPPPLSDSRSRSRSPVPRERGHERERGGRAREIDRDRMSREVDQRKLLSRSKERDRSRDRSPLRDGEPLPPGYRRRCRDYDEKGYCMRGDLCHWDHGSDPVVLEDAALTRVLTIPPSVPEYNPLTPDIWANPMTPGYAPFPPHHHAPQPPRELIPIPRVRVMGGAPPSLTNLVSAGPTALIPPRHPPPKKNFEYGRIAPLRQPLASQIAKCSLEVRKVPRGLNDITHLNNHFSKFGKIINIQVCYEGDPEAALITFSNHTDANVAYKSTEAVLNNRFIKVFWHNPENKQDNAPNSGMDRAPGSHNKVFINKDNIKLTQMNKERAAEIANNAEKINAEKKKQDNGFGGGTDRMPGSHNMVYINKDYIKKTQMNKEKATEIAKNAEKNNSEKSDQPTVSVTSGSSATTSGSSSTTSTTTTASKTSANNDNGNAVAQMVERVNNLLRSQTRQQLLHIKKYQSGTVTGEQKAMLLQAILSAQEGIEKLRKEFVTYNNLLSQTKTNKRKTREEIQKDLLDAELDLFIKQQDGQDATQLLNNIYEMRQQINTYPGTTALPMVRPPLRGGRCNTSMRYIRGAAPAKTSVNQSVDHRPRTLLISGFESDELDKLILHFARFGEIVAKDVNLAVPELVIQYKLRQQAEMAIARGKSYNERLLSITWVAGTKPLTPTTSVTTGAADVNEITVNAVEEEEEDDSEDRSWRR